MKTIKHVILSLAIVPSLLQADPKERFEPEEIVETIAFADRLAGSKWIYHWRDRDYEFRFNENGSIGILDGWSNVKWVVAGKEDVILEGGAHKMLLHFNEQKNAFYTRDWDGTKSDGRLAR
ncbi:hypothetical protein [Thalassolituus hydrocarboniclasticus]|uniref:Uncharacterized protein n=1 Tax=Thalassolituus hydrocarboniclasticus TaxID=2742796 RepID=A0ABY6A8S6_9GAMM|nr:hypothetical protein [Thalassolituus hydrocarboniclasticus]UXD87208.1 hypothetical protein HUF19_07100 [Thalassolituus hydrocarboniclasticus]